MEFGQFCETCNKLIKNKDTKLSEYFNENDLARQFYEFDDDCSGTIDYNEFYKWVTGQPPKSSSSTNNTKLSTEFTREKFNESIQLLNPHVEFVCLENILKEVSEKELNKVPKEKNKSSEQDLNKKISSFKREIQKLINADEKKILKEIYLHRYQILLNRWKFEIEQKNYIKIYFLYGEFTKMKSENGENKCPIPPDTISMKPDDFTKISTDILKNYGNNKNINEIFKVPEENFKTPYYMQYIIF